MSTAAAHWTVVREVISSTTSGADLMSALPGLVRRLRDEDAWREFVGPDGKVVRHETFAEFVSGAPPKGLGGRSSQLIALCGTDEELAQWVRSQLLASVPEALPVGTPGHGTKESGTHNTSATRDNAAIVARLKRDDPELAEQVVRGETTANAAARAKGWRKPRIVVSSPERTAQSLRKHMNPDALARLARLLTEDD